MVFIEITLWYECFPVNLLHVFKTRFYKSTSAGLLEQFLIPCVVTEVTCLYNHGKAGVHANENII